MKKITKIASAYIFLLYVSKVYYYYFDGSSESLITAYLKLIMLHWSISIVQTIFKAMVNSKRIPVMIYYRHNICILSIIFFGHMNGFVNIWTNKKYSCIKTTWAGIDIPFIHKIVEIHGNYQFIFLRDTLMIN